jgi:hypothetical protein
MAFELLGAENGMHNLCAAVWADEKLTTNDLDKLKEKMSPSWVEVWLRAILRDRERVDCWALADMLRFRNDEIV